MLEAGDAEDSFLEKSPVALQSISDHLNLPDKIGDFEILGLLGRGGMGVVYRARQCSLNRMVALKVLASGLGLTTKAIMRFKLEAEAAAKLHHTNIVPIYWTGEENRVPYYAMELIEGPSLDQVIKQLRDEAEPSKDDAEDDNNREDYVPHWIKETIISSSAPSDDTDAEFNSSNFDSTTSLGTNSAYYDNLARMIAGVADALAHAHNHGIVHRDIKPANLLLSSDGQLSVNDFGLARILEQPGMTMTGEFMGSPMYMSPEQITAGRLPLDHRTDIYSLGATLYELLTLQAPFPGQQRDQVLSQVMHKDPAKPRSINSQIPKDLETICMKAMEKDPDRRYQTAEHLADDLRRFVNRNAISARRVSALEKGVRWVRKNKAISAMTCLVFLVCLGVGYREYRQWNERILEETMIATQNAILNLDDDEAEDQLEILVDLVGTTIETDLIKYQIDLLKGKGESVVKELEAKIEQNPLLKNDVRIQCLLMNAYSNAGDWANFIEQQKSLSKLVPKTPEENFYLGKILIYADFQTACDYIDDATVGMAGYADFWLTRAWANIFRAIARGRTDTADSLDATSDTADPLDVTPEERLADLKSRLEEIEDAEDDIASAEKICGADVYSVSLIRLYSLLTQTHFLRLMARCEMERGELKLAKEYEAQANACLDRAERYVKDVAPHINVPFGNFNRFYYYDLRLNGLTELPDSDQQFYFRNMEQVLEDSQARNQAGWISDPYWAYCLKTKQYNHALSMMGPNSLNSLNEYDIVRRATLDLEVLSQEGSIDTAELDRVYDDAHKNLPVDSVFKSLIIFGKTEEIKKHFQMRLKAAKSKNLDAPLSRYMLDMIKEEEFLKQSSQTEYELVTAYMYVGLKKLIEGEPDSRKEALKYFRKSTETTMYHWTTFLNCRVYAAKLDPNSPYYEPEWPRWIPAEPVKEDLKEASE